MKDKVTEDEKAYEQFTKLVDSGEFNDAYRKFKQRPALIGFMAPYEISCSYVGFRTYVGNEESELFLLLYIKETLETLESIPVTDALCKLMEEELERKLKEDLGEDYRRWLEEDDKTG